VTEPPSLFRREALEFKNRRPGHGDVLRIEPPWSRWSYWIVLALVAAGVIASATVRTSQSTSGPAFMNAREGTFAALVPSAASSDLERGQLVRLELSGPTRTNLTARVMWSGVADRARLRRAGFASSLQRAVLVTGKLERQADVGALRSSPRPEGRAVVVLRSQRVLDLFLSQLGGMLGSAGGS
jgi:hypothetical protein